MPSRGPIEIISYFGMVPIFRTQLAFKLKKSGFSEFDGGQVVQGRGLRNFGAPASWLSQVLDI